jgi:hypothetical protein
MDVSKVTVILDGEPVKTIDVEGSTAVVRFQRTIPIAVARDGFVVVRVDGARPMAPWVGDDHFKVYPMAVTNPIWIDADGDGRITPVARAAPPRVKAPASTGGPRRRPRR